MDASIQVLVGKARDVLLRKAHVWSLFMSIKRYKTLGVHLVNRGELVRFEVVYLIVELLDSASRRVLYYLARLVIDLSLHVTHWLLRIGQELLMPIRW